MTESQHVEMLWETPSVDVIPTISKQHVEAMETVDDPNVWLVAGMHHVLLQTIGRKSGNAHKVALPFWRDPDGHPILVASFAGSPQNPAWYLNISDRAANPEVLVRDAGGSWYADPVDLDGDDYDKTWAALTADRAWYRDYQAKTSRRIPLVRLVRLRDA